MYSMYKPRLPLTILILLLSSSLTMAQSKIGLLGGLNMSKLSGDAPANAAYSSLMGANLGVLLDIS